jgi:Transposase DDE domain group 1
VQNTARRPKITVSADGKGLVSQSGALLLAETLRATGLGQGLADGLARWRAPRAVHDPGKIIADLELRHRRRARREDRIRCAKGTGLRNFPLHGYAQNQIWCELAARARELLASMAMLALEGPARSWEPNRLRLRLFTTAGRLVRGGRLRLRLAATWPWAAQITAAITQLQNLAPG